MRKLIGKGLIAAAVLLLVLPAPAQEREAPKTAEPATLYKVQFTVHELENGTRVNSRGYTFLLETGREGRVRVGSRVPLSAADEKGVTYMDVGLSLDCTLRGQGSHLQLQVRLEITDFANPPPAGANVTGLHVLRSVRSEVGTVIRPGEPTVIMSLDDAASKRRYQLEVTATKVK